MLTALDLFHLRPLRSATREMLDDIRLARLRRQVDRAWAQTDFYREKYEEAGITSGYIDSLSDLQQLPVVSKQDLRSVGCMAYARDVHLPKCLWVESSGATGAPTRVPLTRLDAAHRHYVQIRALMANGYRPQDRMLAIIAPEDMPPSSHIYEKLGFMRRDCISIYADLDEQISAVMRTKPDVIYGYTSCLKLLCTAMRDAGIEPPRPKMVVSSAEPLDPRTGDLIAEAFGVWPTDMYSNTEFGCIAWQCAERRGYHINADYLIVESLKDGKPAGTGEEGELVITSLYSDAAPLIRCATGNYGVLWQGWCACGLSLPMLAKISGVPAGNVVQLPDGACSSPYVLTSALNRIPGMKNYQVIQESDKTIRVRLAFRGPHAVQPQHVSRAICQALNARVDVIVEDVDAPSGVGTDAHSIRPENPILVGHG